MNFPAVKPTSRYDAYMAANAPANPFAPAEQLLASAIGQRIMPGCAYGVYARGGVCWTGVLGGFTYESNSPRIAPGTRFDIASLTKVVATTAAAMLLAQRNRLDLALKLGDLLPGFVIGREDSHRARNVTLAHLLAHSAGLPGYVELFRAAQTPAQMLTACLALPVEAEPGTLAVYSDPRFILLGKAIEVITGERLDLWCAREIHAPLGMTSTGFNPRAPERALIPPTEIDRQFRQRTIQGEVQDENAAAMNGIAGHAGLFSNVSDLLRFAAAMIEAKPAAEQKTLFHAETIARFCERQPPAGSSRALGWDTPSDEASSAGHLFSSRSIGHLGFSGCSLWMDLDARIAVVLLTNRTWPDRQQQGIKTLRPAFHDAVRAALA